MKQIIFPLTLAVISLLLFSPILEKLRAINHMLQVYSPEDVL